MELRLIPEFSGDSTQNVVEWLAKAELVCKLRGVAHLESVIPPLRIAFAVVSCTAYEQFVGRRLQHGETVDVFLAELRRLAVPFGGLSDNMLACAFVAGLPDTVKQLLRAGSRMEELLIDQILTRARAVLADDVGVAAAVSAMTGAGASVKRANSTLLCYQCNQPNHLARDCLLRQKARSGTYGGRGRGSARCYQCDGLGHLAASCPGNENGGRPSALAFNPDIQ